MTQAAMPVGAEQPQANGDGLAKLVTETDSLMQRLQRSQFSGDTAMLARIIHGDVLDLVKDLMLEVVQLRNWAWSVASDLDDRVGAVESGEVEPETQLLPEDAEKIKALCLCVPHLVSIIMQLGQQPAEIVEELKKFAAQATEVLAIVEETTIQEEEDDDEEEGEEDEVAAPTP